MRRIDSMASGNEGGRGPVTGPTDGRADDGTAPHVFREMSEDLPRSWESDWIDLGGEA